MDRARRLPDDDLDPAVLWLRDLIGGRDTQLTLAASRGADAIRVDAKVDEALPDMLGSLKR